MKKLSEFTREEFNSLPIWQRFHYGIGASGLPLWKQVAYYAVIAFLPLMFLWTVWCT